MISVKTPDDKIWHYRYDPFGRRIGKHLENPDARTICQIQYQYDGDQLIGQKHYYRDGSLIKQTQYLYQPNSFVPLVQIHNQRLRYIITDQIGTPRELLTANGQVAWYAYKEVAGMFYQSHCKVDEPSDHSSPQRYIQGEETCDLRYQGQLHDNESGLYYNRFRYFDPDANQYLTPDPIGLAGGIRPQAYVENPLSWVDVLGLAKEGCEKGKYLRGGKKNQRDQWFGYEKEKGFQRWWHRQGKGPGGSDLGSKADADSAFSDWINLGKPVPK